MKTWKTWLLLSVVVVFIAACSSTRVFSDFSRSHNFDSYKTYAWLPSIDTSERSIYKNEIVMNRIHNAVNKELQERGYKIDNENPDFLVMTRLMIEEKKETYSTPTYNYYSPYYFNGFYPYRWRPYYYSRFYAFPLIQNTYEIREVEYTEGTIVVDVIDEKKGSLVWRGWSEKRMNEKDLQKAEVVKNIDKIFETYPVP